MIISDSVAALTQSGSKSLFKEVEQKDADGNVSMGYDTDKIYQNVKSFVDNYNDVIKAEIIQALVQYHGQEPV